MSEWSVAMVYSPALRNTVVLNACCYLLWQLCDGRRTLSEIETLIQEHFANRVWGPARIRQEVKAALVQLYQAHLLLTE